MNNTPLDINKPPIIANNKSLLSVLLETIELISGSSITLILFISYVLATSSVKAFDIDFVILYALFALGSSTLILINCVSSGDDTVISFANLSLE